VVSITPSVTSPITVAHSDGRLLTAQYAPIKVAVISVAFISFPFVFSLFSGGEAAKSFADSVKDLSSSVDDYKDSISRMGMSTEELKKNFGEASKEVRKLLMDMAELEKRETQRAARAAIGSAKESLGVFDGAQFGVGNQKNLADLFDLSVWSSEARKSINEILGLLNEVDSATTLDNQLEAARKLRDAFQEAAEANKGISAAEDAVLGPLNEMVLKLFEAKATQDQFAQSTAEAKAQAEGVRSSVENISASLGSMDQNSLSRIFTAAFPAASQLLDMAQGIFSTLSSGAAAVSSDPSGAPTGASANPRPGKGRPTVRGRGRGRTGGTSRSAPARPAVMSVSAKNVATPYVYSGARAVEADDAEKQAKSIDEVLESLQAEVDMIGKSGEARRLHQELQKAGVDIYSEEGQKIAALVEELTLLEAKQNLVSETMRGIENAAQGFFVGVLSGAKDLQTAIGDLLRELGNLFLNQAFKMLWEGKPGGGGGIGGWLAGLFDAGGRIPAGQLGIVAEKRPEFVDGKLVNRPTLVPGPANVTGGAATAGILNRAQKAVPSGYRDMSSQSVVSAPRISVSPPPVVVIDDPRKIDEYNRSLKGERSYARTRRRMANA